MKKQIWKPLALPKEVQRLSFIKAKTQILQIGQMQSPGNRGIQAAAKCTHYAEAHSVKQDKRNGKQVKGRVRLRFKVVT